MKKVYIISKNDSYNISGNEVEDSNENEIKCKLPLRDKS